MKIAPLLHLPMIQLISNESRGILGVMILSGGSRDIEDVLERSDIFLSESTVIDLKDPTIMRRYSVCVRALVDLCLSADLIEERADVDRAAM